MNRSGGKRTLTPKPMKKTELVLGSPLAKSGITDQSVKNLSPIPRKSYDSSTKSSSSKNVDSKDVSSRATIPKRGSSSLLPSDIKTKIPADVSLSDQHPITLSSILRLMNTDQSDTKDLIKRMEGELAIMSEELSKLREYKISAESKMKDDAKRLIELEKRAKDTEEKCTEYEEDLSKYLEENKMSQGGVIEINKEALDKANADNKRLQDELDTINIDIKRFEDRVEKLKDDFKEDLRTSVERETENLKSQIRPLTHQLGERDRNIEDLRTQIRESSIRLEEKDRQIENLNTQVSTLTLQLDDRDLEIFNLKERLRLMEEKKEEKVKATPQSVSEEKDILKEHLSTNKEEDRKPNVIPQLLPVSPLPKKNEAPKESISGGDIKSVSPSSAPHYIPMLPFTLPSIPPPAPKDRTSKKALAHGALNCLKWHGSPCTTSGCGTSVATTSVRKTRGEIEAVFVYALFGETSGKLSGRSYTVCQTPDQLREEYKKRNPRNMAFSWAVYATMMNLNVDRTKANRHIPGREEQIVSAEKIIGFLEMFCKDRGILVESDHRSTIKFL